MLKKIKDRLYDTIIHDIYISIIYLFYPIQLKLQGVNRSKPTSKLPDSSRDKRIVVSLTTIPQRIKSIHKTIYSIFNQETKPDLIVLYLSNELFPNQMDDVTNELKRLQEYGLVIKFCKDLKSYTKLIYALKEYPNDLIIVSDDDVYHKSKWIKRLYDAYLNDPSCVCAYTDKKYVFEDNLLLENRIEIFSKQQSVRIFGVSGALFPPHCFNKEVLNEEVFLKYCSKNDDVWFSTMLILNNALIQPLKPTGNIYVEWLQEKTPCLWKENSLKNVMVEQRNNISNYYNKELKSIYKND